MTTKRHSLARNEQAVSHEMRRWEQRQGPERETRRGGVDRLAYARATFIAIQL